MSNFIELDRREGVTIVKFSRPELRNPLSVPVLEELQKIVDAAGSSRVVFAGSHGSFASGADLREVAAVNEDQAIEFAMRGQKLMTSISRLAGGGVAAIDGPCFGGALDLSLACCYRIASPNATFSHPGANLGIITGWGGTQRLPRLIGQARALELLFTADRIGAKRAFEIGLIDSIEQDPLNAALNLI